MQPSVRRERCGSDGRPAHEDLLVRGDPHVGAEQRYDGPARLTRRRGPVAGRRLAVPRQRCHRRGGDLRAGLGETVGERHGDTGGPGLRPQRGEPPGLRRAARSAVLRPLETRVQQPLQGVGDEAHDAHTLLAQGLQGRVELEALVDDGGGGVDRAPHQDRESAHVRQRHHAQPALAGGRPERHGRAEGTPQQVAVGELDLLRLLRWCRRCASRARSRRGRGPGARRHPPAHRRPDACPRPHRSRRRPERAPSARDHTPGPLAAARTPTGAGRSARREHREACTRAARGRSRRRLGSRSRHGCRGRRRGLRAPSRRPARPRRAAHRRGRPRASAAPDARVAHRRRGRAIRRPPWRTG